MTDDARSSPPSHGRKILYAAPSARFFLSHRLALAIAAQQEGYEVGVACPADADLTPILQRNMEHFPLPLRNVGMTLLGELKSFLQFFRIYHAFRPDVVHLIAAKSIIYGGIAARIMRIRRVLAISGLGHVFISKSAKARALRQVVVAGYRLVVSHPDSYAIFQNDDDRSLLSSLGITRRANVVMIRGSGVDLEQFTPRPLPPGAVVLALPARLLKDKGVQEFVEMARLLKSQGSGAEFRLIGDPDDGNPTSISRDQIRGWVDAGIVQWHHHTDDIATALAECHIVVLPSYREGFPKTLIDAAAAGRASAAANVPGCRDAIVDGVTGVLFAVRDPADMVRMIKPLIEDRDKIAAMAAAAREHAEQAFDIREISRQHLAVYRRATEFQ